MSNIRIYAMGCSGHIKFGISNSPKQRLSTLQVAVPFEVKLLSQSAPMERDHALSLERVIHGSLAQYHARGEWFRSAPKTLAAVELLREKQPNDLLSLFAAWAKERADNATKEPRYASSDVLIKLAP